MPKVGIFWSINNELVFVRTQEIENAVTTDISIDSAFSHSDEWDKIPQVIKRQITNAKEYFEIPRGRILFMK